MASAGGTPQKGTRHKSLDAEINLVPFIDLLSMCICFLLMTAVWMEIGALQVKQLVGTEGSAAKSNSFEVDVKFFNKNKIELSLTHPNKKVQKFTAEGGSPEAMLSRLGDVLGGLGSVLKLNPKADLKTQMAQAISSAKVTPKTGVSYGDLIGVMDQLRNHGIINLGVIPMRE